MPATSIINGQTVWVPQVEVATDVVSDEAGVTPTFLTGVVMGQSWEGTPYNAASTQLSDEEPAVPFRLCGTSSAVAEHYGPYSPMHVATAYAKKAKLPPCYFVSMSSLVRARVIATSTGPVNQAYIYPKKWGAPGGWTKIKFASSILTVTPVRNYALLSANASTSSKRIYLKGDAATGVPPNSWLRVGMTIDIGHNTATEKESLTVAEFGQDLDSNGQTRYWVDLSAAPATAYATSTYAMIVEYEPSTSSRIEVSGTLSTAQAVIDWIKANSLLLGASPHADFTDAALIAVNSAARILDLGSTWGTVVAGTSPAPTTSDYTTFVTSLLATEYDAFVERTGVMPRLFLVLDSATAVHAAIATLTTELAALGRDIQVYTGCGYTDTVVAATDSTSPVWRAQQLNSQDIYIAAGKLDRLAPYLSLASQAFGYKMSGGVGFDLCQKGLYYGRIDRKWDEINSSELTSLHKYGVITYRLAHQSATPRFVISQDINTLQVRNLVANEQTNDSGYGVWRLRMIYINWVLAQLITDSQLGGRSISAPTIQSILIDRGNNILFRGGHLVEPLTISSIDLVAGTTWEIVCNTQPPGIANFFAITNRARVG